MFFMPPDSFSTIVFLIIMAAVLMTFFIGVYRARQKLKKKPRLATAAVVVGTFIWLIIFALIVRSGVVKDYPTFGVPIFFFSVNLVAVLIALSPIGRWLAEGIPISSLVAFQLFRIPLEWTLHNWAEQGTIPESMTWNGQNWDVFSGFMALAFFMTVRRQPKLAWIPNVVGFVLLLNVMRVAVLSSPVPFAWTVTPPLQLAFHLPYAFIAPIAISGALMGHIILTRALLRKP